MTERIKLGIAFAGGGTRGASHLGFVKALHEHRIYPEVFAGTSAGAIVASLLAYGYEPDEALSKFVEASDSIIDVAYGHILKGVLTTDKIEGLAKGKCLEDLLREMLKGDSTHCLGVVTTDINQGKQVIFSTELPNQSLINDDNFDLGILFDGNVADIVRASASIPTIFVPKEYGDYKLVDGGLTNNLPCDVAWALGANRVISLDLGYAGKTETTGIFDILNMSLNVLMSRNIDGNRKDFGLYMNPKIYDVTSLEIHRMKECYDRGYEYGRANINNILMMLDGDDYNEVI